MKITLAYAVGIIQSAEGLTRTKRWKKRKLDLLWSWDSLFSCPQVRLLLVLGLQTPSGAYTIGSSGS